MPAKGLAWHSPGLGNTGWAWCFLPPDRDERHQCEKRFEDIVRDEGQTVLGWRSVPTDNLYLGETAKSCEPFVRQVFIGRNPALTDDMAFERKLYVIRRRAENAMRYGKVSGGEFFYIVESVV